MSFGGATGLVCIPSARLLIYPPLRRSDLPGLYARTCALLQSGPELLVCEVGGIPVDAVAADALARLKLACLRNRCALRFEGASPELVGLLELTGLRSAVLPP